MRCGSLIFATGGSFKWHASIIRAAGLGRELRAAGVHVRYVLMDAADSRELLRLFGMEDVCHWVERGRNPLRFFGADLGAAPPDIVHVINAPVAGQVVSWRGRRSGAKVIADWDEWLSRVPFGLLHSLKWRILEHLAVLGSDAFVFSSKYLREAYRTRLGNRPTAYIPYGMSIERRPEGLDTAGKAVLDPGVAWVAYTGSMHSAYKDDLLELVALARVCRELGLGLTVVGDGSERLWVEGEVRGILAPERVAFPGWLTVDALDSFLARKRIRACFLPLGDTVQNRCRCPNKMFHYVKAGRTVVTNRVGEVANLLGEQAFYYEPRDVGSLRDAVKEAVSADARYDLEAFSWRRRAQSYLEFVKTL